MHKEDQGNVEQLIDDTHINDLIIVDDYLFYSRFDDSKMGLYRSNLDGKQEKLLLEELVNGLQFYDGWLYTAISSGGSVVKIAPNGKKDSELATEDGVPISTTN